MVYGMGRKLTTKEFIVKAVAVHGDKYCYDKVEYVVAKTPVIIVCFEHGEFKQTPDHHLSGQGCKRCGHVSNGDKKRTTTDGFKTQAKKVHGDQYEYSKVEYITSHINIIINCSEHGEFKQTPGNHLSGQGCPKCGYISSGDKQRTTTDGFKTQAKKVHGDQYEYSKVEYIASVTKVIINCSEHGEFKQTPGNHLSGQGCPKCGYIYRGELLRYSTADFIEKARVVHDDQYEYSKVEYIASVTKVIINCSEHGEFKQAPGNHLSGQGCPKCGDICCGDMLRSTTPEFIKNANVVHGDKYDYSKVEYVEALSKVIIVCSEHGEFKQTPGSHLSGNGCPKCGGISSGDKQRTTMPEFIKNANVVHGDKYDYSKAKYVNNQTKVIIVCSEHGEFKQTPNGHLSGRGCHKCTENKMPARAYKHLTAIHQPFDTELTLDGLSRRFFDLVLHCKTKSVLIEFDGGQHVKPVTFGGISDQRAYAKFVAGCARDEEKNQFCAENGITLIRIGFWEKDAVIDPGVHLDYIIEDLSEIPDILDFIIEENS